MEEKYGKNAKVCKHGLNDIWVNGADGSVRMCGWSNYFIGELAKNTIEEVWHGQAAEIFRESMLDGSYRYCNHAKCPYCANGHLEEQFVEYKVPKYPTNCNLGYQLQCNYTCKFCREEHYLPSPEEKGKYLKIEKELKKILPSLNEIASNGCGELFCSDSILNFLGHAELLQNTKVSLETNGSLFNEKNWNKISNLGKHDLTVYVTVHSFDEDTYQYLSGTKLPIQNIIDNLHFISNLREKGVINHLEIATVICEYNFRQMPRFVEKCLTEFNVDRIRLRFFEPYGVMDKATEWFYDIRNPYHPYYDEFKRIMENPIFDNEKVWKWQGETLSLQQENPYVLERKNFLAMSALIMLEAARKKIRSYMDCLNNPRVALYGAGQGGKAYIHLLRKYGMDVDTIFDTYACEETTSEYKIIRPSLENVNNYDLIIVTQNTPFIQIKENLERMAYNGIIKDMNHFIKELSNY